MLTRNILCALALALLVSPLFGGEAAAQVGLLTGGAQKLDPITLSSGKPLTNGPYQLEAGKYYEIEEIVINDIEIRPLGVDSLEFDDEGTAEISFVTIRPGTFTLRIPGTTADSQKAVFQVK